MQFYFAPYAGQTEISLRKITSYFTHIIVYMYFTVNYTLILYNIVTHIVSLTLSGPGYLMSLKVRGGGGTCAPPLISKSTNSILMTLYATLCKNCSHFRSAICFKIGLGLAEIIRCLCTKVVFL